MAVQIVIGKIAHVDYACLTDRGWDDVWFIDQPLIAGPKRSELLAPRGSQRVVCAWLVNKEKPRHWRIAEPCSVFEDYVEDRLFIIPRAADGFENFLRRRLAQARGIQGLIDIIRAFACCHQRTIRSKGPDAGEPSRSANGVPVQDMRVDATAG